MTSSLAFASVHPRPAPVTAGGRIGGRLAAAAASSSSSPCAASAEGIAPAFWGRRAAGAAGLVRLQGRRDGSDVEVR